MNNVISPVKIEARRKLGVRSGDTVRVHQKVIDRGKTRTQIFEGLVIAVKHGNEAGGSFTVRTTLSGIGVEKIFPLYTPLIEKIEIVKRSKVRRAKLYFIREKAAKAVRRQLRNARMMNISTEDIIEEESTADSEAETSTETEKEIQPEEAAVSTKDKATAEEEKPESSPEDATSVDEASTEAASQSEEKKEEAA